MQKLLLAEDVFDALENGKKTTIREGRRDIAIGKLLFESTEQKRTEVVNVIMVSYCRLGNVFIGDIQNDGFKDHDDMWRQMLRFYPDIDFDTEVTVVKFTSGKIPPIKY